MTLQAITSIKVTVTSNADISSYSDFTLSSPERVVVDFAGNEV